MELEVQAESVVLAEIWAGREGGAGRHGGVRRDSGVDGDGGTVDDVVGEDVLLHCLVVPV
jgi:hypothetical protein